MDIYIPKIREASFNESHTTVKGYIKWEVINKDGSISQQGEHPNLILNAGLDGLAVRAFAESFKYNCVGTGNSTPIETQIALDNEVARTGSYLTSPTGSCGSSLVDNNAIYTRTFNWPAGSINTPITGPLTEVGFSWASTAGSNLWSRSLFKNSGGTPISINCDSDQQLRVSYTLTVSIGTLAWTTNTVNITGLGAVTYKSRSQASVIPGYLGVYGLNSVYTDGSTSYSTVYNFEPMTNSSSFITSSSENCSRYELSFVNASYPTAESLPTGALPTAFGLPYVLSNANNYTVPFTSSAYVAGTYYKTRTITADVNTANGNIQWIFSATTGGNSNGYEDRYRPFAYFFPTPIAKDNLHTLTLNFTHSWGRA